MSLLRRALKKVAAVVSGWVNDFLDALDDALDTEEEENGR